MLRKFLIVVAIIVSSSVENQLYGMIFVVQAALLLHVLFRPYTSGRQFRLELWSLTSLILTLFTDLYSVEQSQSSSVSLALSSFVLIMHIFIIFAFLFFIGRGLTRRFLPNTWSILSSCWKRNAKLKKVSPKYYKAENFMHDFANATEYDRTLMYTNYEIWWNRNPNYKRKRIISFINKSSKGTPLEYNKERNEVELNVIHI